MEGDEVEGDEVDGDEDDVVEGVSVTTVVDDGVATVVLEHDDAFSVVSSSTTPVLTFTGIFCVFVDNRGLVFATKTPDCDAFGVDNNIAVSLPLKFKSFPTTIGVLDARAEFVFSKEDVVGSLLVSVTIDSGVLVDAVTMGVFALNTDVPVVKGVATLF